MIPKKQLLQRPNYLLSKYQIEIFRQLENYRKDNHLTQKGLAKKLGVSTSYINQVLKGNFNFTLKKLIQLGIAINKIPSIEFLSVEDYWSRHEAKKQNVIIAKLSDDSQVLVKIKQLTNAQQISSYGTFSNEDVQFQDVWVNQSFN